MSTVYANVPFNLNTALNLNSLIGGTVAFFDNANFTSALGNVYADAYRVQTGGTQRAYFLGTGFRINAEDEPTEGTVQAYQQESLVGANWVAQWGIEGYSIPVVDFYNAAKTPSAGDDAVLIARALAGNDSFRLSEGADWVRGQGGNDTIRGMGGDDVLLGDDGDDLVEGGAGGDLLYGNVGADTLVGGTGNDTYFVDGTDTIVETSTFAGEQDIVRSTGSQTLGANLEVLVLDGAERINGAGNGLNNQIFGNSAANILAGNAGNDVLRGGGGNDRIDGGTGNDSIDGGTGNDTMAGGTGNDSYFVDRTGDVVVETSTVATETDIVSSTVGHTLAANVEVLILAGSAPISGTGNALANRIYGNDAANLLSGLGGNDLLVGQGGNDTLAGSSGNDSLDGGAGADTMVGGTGNDRYLVADVGDRVIEVAGAGADAVESAIGYRLPAAVESLVLTGVGSINGIGNELANRIDGNAGNNLLDGGAGADTLAGGAGNDNYVVDQAGDVVAEAADAGIDTVRSGVTWTLGVNTERLVLTGTGAIGGTGNTLANGMTGNAADNVLDGGGGADTLAGGAGDDTYVVDQAGDVVAEAAGAGVDTVRAAITWMLGSTFENLALTGNGAIDGTGNALDNRLSGNSGDNRLDGGSGADTMAGGAGNDTYVVDQAGDRVTEAAGAGTDLVRAAVAWTLGTNVENLALTGSRAIAGTGNGVANQITGNGAANRLDGDGGNDRLAGGGGNDTLGGGEGNDTLDGGAGRDALTGGTGADVFRFASALDAAGNVDALADFNPADDRFELDDAVFTALGAAGPLEQAAFVVGTAATDASHRIVHDATSGELLYDADGVGGVAAVLFASVVPGTVLTFDDFWVG